MRLMIEQQRQANGFPQMPVNANMTKAGPDGIMPNMMDDQMNGGLNVNGMDMQMQ